MRSSWTLDDGTGPATVVLRQSTGLRRPWLERGELRGVVGIVGRDEDEVLLLPRVAVDIGAQGQGGAEAPMLLPATGGATP